eukprot:scaffold7366_cov254-Pinguiococcus_pyrenoidosus.AAC.21
MAQLAVQSRVCHRSTAAKTVPQLFLEFSSFIFSFSFCDFVPGHGRSAELRARFSPSRSIS